MRAQGQGFGIIIGGSETTPITHIQLREEPMDSGRQNRSLVHPLVLRAEMEENHDNEAPQASLLKEGNNK